MELYKSHLADGAVAEHVPLLEITWAQPGIAVFIACALVHAEVHVHVDGDYMYI